MISYDISGLFKCFSCSSNCDICVGQHYIRAAISVAGELKWGSLRTPTLPHGTCEITKRYKYNRITLSQSYYSSYVHSENTPKSFTCAGDRCHLLVQSLIYILIGCIEGINSSNPEQNGCRFGRRHFQMHFLEWKWYYSNSNFTEIYSEEHNWQKLAWFR